MLIVIMSNQYQVKEQLLKNYYMVDDMIHLTNTTYSKEEKICVDTLYKTEIMFLNTLSSIYYDLYNEEYDDIENKQRLLMLCANRKINIGHIKKIFFLLDFDVSRSPFKLKENIKLIGSIIIT